MRIILAICFVFLNCTIIAQQAQIQQDSTASDSVVESDDDAYGVFKTFSGNPGKAALYSLVIPGTGQLFNKRYWKVPLALAIEGTAIFFVIENSRLFRQWDDEWKFQVANSMPSGNVTDISDATAVGRQRDAYKQNRDYAIIGLIASHILISADAFIDRHLIEFDVSEDLSVRFSPIAPTIGMNFLVSF